MFNDKEIISLANEARDEFSKLHETDCKIALKSLDDFWNLAKKSRLIQQEVKLGLPLKVGSLVIHGKEETIILNKEIINNLTSNKDFVKALVMHELYHILLKNNIRNLGEAVNSELKDNKLFNKEFPKYYKILGFI